MEKNAYKIEYMNPWDGNKDSAIVSSDSSLKESVGYDIYCVSSLHGNLKVLKEKKLGFLIISPYSFAKQLVSEFFNQLINERFKSNKISSGSDTPNLLGLGAIDCYDVIVVRSLEELTETMKYPQHDYYEILNGPDFQRVRSAIGVDRALRDIDLDRLTAFGLPGIPKFISGTVVFDSTTGKQTPAHYSPENTVLLEEVKPSESPKVNEVKKEEPKSKKEVLGNMLDNLLSNPEEYND